MMRPIFALVLGSVAAPLSIGMGLIVQALFPGLAGTMAGMIGGAITLPLLVALVGMARS
ncbi:MULTISPECIES: hypothetical protein [unclassified Ancylobacter]|uniref:hypothetical protein n=1 Tax=unclassified Ancylobacter TaxID=2626613 RepID=UPI00226EBD57|nr:MULTISPECIES: hypothetical protein [unclassified Ancylobacter]WAC26407.1 hypothetical protein OU996_15480 [Ancylobacter sp. SL191]WGD31225.1 hypothetical protein AncyloWKF20_05220 [Ancylobacter sp. WKF20]